MGNVACGRPEYGDAVLLDHSTYYVPLTPPHVRRTSSLNGKGARATCPHRELCGTVAFSRPESTLTLEDNLGRQDLNRRRQWW
jgi:hypothetical protein